MTKISEITSNQWCHDINNPGTIVQGLDAIKQAVYLILITQKGTVPLQPDFGCGAYDHIDSPVNIAAPKMIKEITEALTKYEPRIDSVKVTYQVSETDASNMTFKISYRIKNTVSTDQLNITYGNKSSNS